METLFYSLWATRALLFLFFFLCDYHCEVEFSNAIREVCVGVYTLGRHKTRVIRVLRVGPTIKTRFIPKIILKIFFQN